MEIGRLSVSFRTSFLSREYDRRMRMRCLALESYLSKCHRMHRPLNTLETCILFSFLILSLTASFDL